MGDLDPDPLAERGGNLAGQVEVEPFRQAGDRDLRAPQRAGPADLLDHAGNGERRFIDGGPRSQFDGWFRELDLAAR